LKSSILIILFVLANVQISLAIAQTRAIPKPTEPDSVTASGYIRPHDKSKRKALIFVHGVLGDYKSSWTSSNGVYWPLLVGRDNNFKDANIYVHQYESRLLESVQDIEELAIRLGDYLKSDGVISDHDQIGFVAHSMGGLVTRAFLVQERLPPTKVPFIYFFGTPSAGANAASIAKVVSKNAQFRNMSASVKGSYVDDLARKWLATSQDQATGYPRRIWSYCAYERKEFLGFIIVDQASATHLCNVPPRAILSDHIDMVKPDSASSEAHVSLRSAYRFAMSPAGAQTLAALNSPTEMSGTVSWTSLASAKPSKLRYNTVFVDAGSLLVDCNEIRQGERTLFFDAVKGEQILGVITSFENIKGMAHSSVSVSAWDKNKIAYKYDLAALKGNQVLNCPNAGAATVKVKYLLLKEE